ncbi:uncharacterized protein [Porites lutea]|uniref:uncharacterized protein n=1 Tax=Porites lutea TaxID=51062 RepID=UPI003CC639B0
MVASYSLNLRWRVVYLLVQGFTVERVARLLHVGKTFVKKIRNLYQNTKTVHYQSRPGRVRQLEDCFSHLDLAQDVLFIRRVIQQYPEIYEDEIQEWIQFALGKTIHVSTIAKLLKKMGFTRRKLNTIAKERDERSRAMYRRRIAQFSREQLLFIDESAKDERTFQRRYTRELQGTGRLSVKGNFTRGTRYSVLSAISTQGVIASHVITGAYNRGQFEFSMLNFVQPHIGSVARGEPRSVVVMDNCNIHYSDVVIEAIRLRGAMVIFLPPYSPDLNPIEDSFQFAKDWLRRHPEVCIKYPKRCFEIALEQKPYLLSTLPLTVTRLHFKHEQILNLNNIETSSVKTAF